MTWRIHDETASDMTARAFGSRPETRAEPATALQGHRSGAASASPASAVATGTVHVFPDHWWKETWWNDLRLAGAWADEIAKITLTPPPDAATTRTELDELLNKQASPEREARRAEILEEADGPPSLYRRTLFLDQGRRPLTWALLGRGVVWSRMFVMSFKHKYKRPRPSQIEPRLRLMVDCPRHPAYPSGHSTQSHFVALLLGRASGSMDVEQAMWEAADRIAENREYAGVHYASDSAVGVELSRAIFPIFEAHAAAAFDAARRAEW
jgi:hypothetical protein